MGSEGVSRLSRLEIGTAAGPLPAEQQQTLSPTDSKTTAVFGEVKDNPDFSAIKEVKDHADSLNHTTPLASTNQTKSTDALALQVDKNFKLLMEDPSSSISANMTFEELAILTGVNDDAKKCEKLARLCAYNLTPKVQSKLLYADIRDTTHTSQQLETLYTSSMLVHELDHLVEFKNQLISDLDLARASGDAGSEKEFTQQIKKVDEAINKVSLALRLSLVGDGDVLDSAATADQIAHLKPGESLMILFTICGFSSYSHAINIKFVKDSNGDVQMEVRNTGFGNQFHESKIADSFFSERKRYISSQCYPPNPSSTYNQEFFDQLIEQSEGSEENPISKADGLYSYAENALGVPSPGRTHKEQLINNCYAKAMGTSVHEIMAPGLTAADRDSKEELLYLKYRSFVLEKTLNTLEMGNPTLNPASDHTSASDFEKNQAKEIATFINTQVSLQEQNSLNVVSNPTRAIYNEIIGVKLRNLEDKFEMLRKYGDAAKGGEAPDIEEIKGNISLLRLVGKEVTNDKDTMLELVQHDGLALQYIGEELKDDEEILLTAVLQNPEAIQYTSNPQFVKHAIEQNSINLFKYASEKLRKNEEFILDMIFDGYPMILKFMSNQLKEDPAFILKVAAQKTIRASFVIAQASEELRGNGRFMLTAAKQFGNEVLRSATDNLKSNPHFITNAINQSGNIDTLRYASPKLLGDGVFLMDIMEWTREAKALEYASDYLINNPMFLWNAAKALGAQAVLPYIPPHLAAHPLLAPLYS